MLVLAVKKKEPDVVAIAGLRTFKGARKLMGGSGMHQGNRLFAPFVSVEIDSEKPCRIVPQERIDADEGISFKVRKQDLVHERRIVAGVEFCGCVPEFPRARTVPVPRKYVIATTEQRLEKPKLSGATGQHSAVKYTAGGHLLRTLRSNDQC